MHVRMEDVINPGARFDARSAVIGGLIVGALMWLLSHGMPWFASGMVSPTLLGRYLKPGGLVDTGRSLVTAVAEVGVSVVYTLILALVVTRLRGLWAIALGGVVGVALYFLNYALFRATASTDWTGSELPVLVTHIAFGMIAAGTYKGLAARRIVPDRRLEQT